jgi:ribonuclease E
MTFTEAAIEVLRREGKPLHFKKIAEIAVRENLLDHVGKVPEETMADQIAAHCRLPRVERRVLPVQPGTFALAEWGLEEDPSGLEALVEQPLDVGLLYRGRERHPVPSRELARTAGRGEGGRARRRDDEERRGRRYPPPAEVAYEILAGAGRPLTLAEIAAQGAERLLMPDAFVRDTGSLGAALTEDNRRRETAGRKPLFQVETDAVILVAQPEPGERAAVSAPPRAASSAAEIRRASLAALRRRLRDCDGPTIEHVAGKLLEKLGFRDLKVAKRGREHVIYTARRQMGLGDVRHGVRIVRSGGDAGRRDVADLRRDLAHYGAQMGIVLTAGDAGREARGEAAAAGQLPIVLLCGDALAEALAEASVGCAPIVVPEVDDAFFRSAAEAAEREEAARRARREERSHREPREESRPRGGREAQEPREPRQSRESREPREGRESREVREGREPREAREGREPREAREGREPREAREGREPREAREGREPRESRADRGDEDVKDAPGAPLDLAGPAAEDSTSSGTAIGEGDVVSPARVTSLGESAENGDDDEGDEGDDEGAEEEGPEGSEADEAGQEATSADGAAGDRRRRRRRRRRRGGRGRGREAGTAGPEASVAGPKGAPAGAESGPPPVALPGGESPGPADAPRAASPSGPAIPTPDEGERGASGSGGVIP